MAKKKSGGFGFYAVIAARLLLGGLLVYTGYIKLLDLPKFAEDVSNFKMMPLPLNRVTAIVLPWNELVVGCLLILGIWSRAAALASLFFFTVFAIAVTSAIARNLNIECGCLGHADASKVGLATLAKDAVGLALAGFVYFATVPAKVSKAKQ